MFREVLNLSSAVMTAVAALFGLWHVLQNQEHGRTVRWFEEKWNRINASTAWNLPNVLMGGIVRAKERVDTYVSLAIDNSAIYKISLLAPFTLAAGMYFMWGGLWSLVASLLLLIIPAQAVLRRARAEATASSVEPGLTEETKTLIRYSFLVVPCINFFVWYILIASLTPMWAVLASFVLAPVLWIGLFLPTSILSGVAKGRVDDEVFHYSAVLSLAGLYALFFTSLAYYVGVEVAPHECTPPRHAMLLANIVCDGLTILFTLKLFKYASVRSLSSFLGILCIVLTALAISSFFACVSIVLATSASESPIGLSESLRLLAFNLILDKHTRLGTSFFAMNTALGPIAVFLLLLVIALCGKLIILPFRFLLGRARVQHSPLLLTSALSGFMAALLKLGSLAVK